MSAKTFAVLKEMQAEVLAWGDDHRALGPTALARLLEARMAAEIERHLERVAGLDQEDRRIAEMIPLLVTGAPDAFMSEVARRFSPPEASAPENPAQG